MTADAGTCICQRLTKDIIGVRNVHNHSSLIRASNVYVSCNMDKTSCNTTFIICSISIWGFGVMYFLKAGYDKTFVGCSTLLFKNRMCVSGES